MKKILIISYFFPPCNLTASQRIMGWATYLSEFGYYPTIVTRNWDYPINSPEDALISSGSETIHQKNDQFEVYYLPYVASRRDLLFSKSKDKSFFKKVSKVLTFKDQIIENISNKAIPFSNLYDFSLDLIEKDTSFKALIISGNPFVQFKFGSLLNKNTGIKWIADYRDDWNTSELNSNGKGFKKIISIIQSKSEKKWVSSAECITSVSKFYANKIGYFVNKESFQILNGFDGLIDSEKYDQESNIFNITYNGSLYPTQPIEIILDAIKKVILNEEIQMEVYLNFPGLGFDKTQKSRVEKEMKGFEKYIHITDRIPKSEVIQIQRRSDLLLMVSHKDIKGIPSSKMYEYIGLKKPILLYPNDHDIVEETLNDTGLGIICNDENEIYSQLLKLIKAKQEGQKSELSIDPEKIEFYSRKNQTAELAKLLDKLT